MAHAGDGTSDPSWVLTDAHVLLLSQQLTDVGSLRTLAYRGLKLESSDIESAITNAPNDIQTAAYNVLQTWMKQQGKREDVYPHLVKFLNECSMNMLALKLKEWVEAPNPETQISQQRIKDIQRWMKQSYGSAPFCLVASNDWTLKSKKVHIRKVYTDVRLNRRLIEAHDVERKPLEDLSEMLREVELGEEKPFRVILQAESGMGKTTALKYLAVSWSEGSITELSKFQFVFHIALKRVKDNSSIENIIISQHGGLQANKVKPEEIKYILEGQANGDGKVLLLIDGHDEYKPGTNSDIDKAIEKKCLWNCRLILTSREREEVERIKEYMDAEFEIEGFDGKSIKEYISRSFAHDDTKPDQLLEEASAKGLCLSDGKGGFIYDFSFLMIPLLLNMIITLFVSKMTLPRTKTGIIDSIVNKIIDREAIRAKGQKALASANTALLKIGKLAWQGLSSGTIIFQKSKVEKEVGREALALGLLIGTEDDTRLEEEVDGQLCFPHISFQEFSSGKYLAQLSKAEWEVFFPTWFHIRMYQEVIKFAVGLSKQPLDLIEFIYQKLIIFLRCNIFLREDVIFLKSLRRELNTEVSFNMFSNKYISYITEEHSTIYIPSQLYVLNNNAPNSQAVTFHDEHLVQSPLNTECSLSVSPRVLQDALCILKKIQQKLSVSLSNFGIREVVPDAIYNVRALDINLLKSTLKLSDRTVFFSVISYNFSPTAFAYIALQLKGCVSLRFLFFKNTAQFVPTKLGESIATLRSLQIAHLQQIQMTLISGRAIMKGLSQCQGLQELRLDGCLLTDCLKDLLGGLDHGGFHSLQILGVESTKLCKNDVKAIADAMNRGIICDLRHLYLSKNPLTNCLATLVPLGDDHHPGFKTLQLLGVCSCDLSSTDIMHLSRAFQLNKFPALIHLDISHNCLTGQISSLLHNPASAGYLSLEGLNLSHVQPNAADLKHLAHFMRTLKAERLRSLHLIRNELTGIIEQLFTEGGLPSVGLLDLQHTELNRKDINSLSRAVKEGKLPHLRKLFLYGNNLSGMETEFTNFLTNCTRYFKRWLIDIKISLKDFPNAEQFQKQILSVCQGTSVSANWTQVKKSSDHTAEIRLGGVIPGVLESVDLVVPSLEPCINPMLYPLYP